MECLYRVVSIASLTSGGGQREVFTVIGWIGQYELSLLDHFLYRLH